MTTHDKEIEEAERLHGLATKGARVIDAATLLGGVYADNALGTLLARFHGKGFEYVNTISDAEQVANAEAYAALHNIAPVLFTKAREHAALVEEVGRLREALEKVANHLSEIVAQDGGCDHSVGICWCPEVQALDEARTALSRPQEVK